MRSVGFDILQDINPTRDSSSPMTALDKANGVGAPRDQVIERLKQAGD